MVIAIMIVVMRDGVNIEKDDDDSDDNGDNNYDDDDDNGDYGVMMMATGTTNGIAAGPEWNSAQHAKTFASENYEG